MNISYIPQHVSYPTDFRNVKMDVMWREFFLIQEHYIYVACTAIRLIHS
jgi:hypothetical protein